jgi:hypothetical protein
MSELDAMIASLRQLASPADVERRVAKKAETTLQAALEKTLAAGQTPEGKPWAPRKTGGRAYEHAASRIVTKASGNLVRTTLSGPEVYGHFGNAHQEPRQMLPDAGAGMPESVEAALTEAAQQVFDEAMGQGGTR